MDCWNPETFDTELREVLTSYSDLIGDYFREDQRLMDEHLSSDPYESLKSNRYHSEHSTLLEDTITPLFVDRSIRVWHYTRLLDDEILSMKRRIVLSTLDSLSGRLSALVQKNLLTQEEADIVYCQSPFHSQEEIRSGRLWSVTVPVSPEYSGVKPFLESWGGESACFRLSDETIAEKLKSIGVPRIVEIETALHDSYNAYSVAKTAIQAWAISLGLSVFMEGGDLAIKDCLKTAQVLQVHTVGDDIFERVAKTYPENCGKRLIDYAG